MNRQLLALILCASALAIASAGCDSAPGKPKPGLSAEAMRPDQITDFSTLYRQNCAACHGDHGKNGAAVALADPIYLQFAGAPNLQHILSAGVPGTMMPGFAKSAGGMLTDQQVTLVTQGLIHAWGGSTQASGTPMPPYAGSLTADLARGQQAFGAFCARCHGADAAGMPGKRTPGSLVDPTYLALISNQGLRTFLVVGRADADNPGEGMPDYRNYQGGPLTDQEITDIVAWLASHRTATPGQVYQKNQ